MPENDDDPREGRSEKWQGYAAVTAIVITLLGIGWQQSQNSGANTVTLANHTAEITALQSTVQNEQVLLYSINAQLTGLNQKMDDEMQVPKGGHQ
jgi:hypothetical protein